MNNFSGAATSKLTGVLLSSEVACPSVLETVTNINFINFWGLLQLRFFKGIKTKEDCSLIFSRLNGAGVVGILMVPGRLQTLAGQL